MKNNSCAAYADTPTSQLLAAGDCCKSDQCERCFLCEEKRCTDILIALLTDRLALYAEAERRKRKRDQGGERA
jgi:hypothetical protein